MDDTGNEILIRRWVPWVPRSKFGRILGIGEMINLAKLSVLNVLANTESGGEISGSALLVQHVVAALVFAALGIVVLAFSFWLMEKVTPFSLKKEIER